RRGRGRTPQPGDRHRALRRSRAPHSRDVVHARGEPAPAQRRIASLPYAKRIRRGGPAGNALRPPRQPDGETTPLMATRAPKKKTTFAVAKALALALPGVEESTSWGLPALKVGGKLLFLLKEDGETLVLRIGLRDRAAIIEAK